MRQPIEKRHILLFCSLFFTPPALFPGFLCQKQLLQVGSGMRHFTAQCYLSSHCQPLETSLILAQNIKSRHALVGARGFQSCGQSCRQVDYRLSCALMNEAGMLSGNLSFLCSGVGGMGLWRQAGSKLLLSGELQSQREGGVGGVRGGGVRVPGSAKPGAAILYDFE
jgi:hypothetical protein